MTNKYENTKKYWDKAFTNISTINPTDPINNLSLEKSIKWISEDSSNLLDFGCGSGKILFRSLFYGVGQVLGIDISQEAINCANKSVNELELDNKAFFEVGGNELLKEINSNSYDGAVLFNIIDNLIPMDAVMVLEQIHRIVKDSGKILIKFNPYINKKLKEEFEFRELEEEFYEEKTGLYIWNLSNEKIKELLHEYFNIEQELIVEFPEYNQTNRMYYLRNKNTKII